MFGKPIHSLAPIVLNEGDLRTRAHKGDMQLEPPFRFGEKYGGSDRVTYGKRDGVLHCDYCGSLHPREVVALLAKGATMDPADRKYGWPHKFYLSNPWGKFYTRHLVDATPEEYEAISKAMRLYIAYDPDVQSVSWQAWYPKDDSTPKGMQLSPAQLKDHEPKETSNGNDAT